MKNLRKCFLVMLITILTAFVFLNSVSSNAASTSWNFKNTGFKNLGTISSSVTVDNLQMNATSSKTMSVKANSVTVNGTSYTYCLALGGAGSTSYRNVKVPVSGASTIKVTLDAAASRTLVVSNSSGSQIGTIAATTTAATQSIKYSGGSGYVYLWSSNSNINIYKIQVDSSGDSGSGSSSSGSSSGSSSSGSTTVTGKSITMNGTKYSTIQAALNAATKSGSYTILLGEGTYNECLYYNGSGTVKIKGQTSSSYGANVKISASNSQTLKKLTQANTTQKARCLFEFEGSGNLILESITLENTFVRPSKTATETQAEAIGFDSTGTFSACNCSFKSHQDTVRTSSKCWFYKCYVEGDVDFIWSERTGRVALFEECKIKSIYDSNTSYHQSFICAPRMDVTSTASKGVVFLNCSIEADSKNDTYLARTPWSSGYYNQVAYINCSMSNVKNVWYQSQISTNYDVTDIGWKLDSKTASNLGVSGKSYVMSDSKKSSEYGDRTKIMNRYFDTSSRSYKSESNGWDLNSFASSMGWISGGSSSGGSSSGGSSSGGSTSGTTITVKNGGTSLASAIKSAKSGTTIIIDGTVKSGAVSVPAGVNISGKNNATIDFSETSGSSGRGLTFKGNGSTVENITVTKASDNGIYIEGSNNTFKYVTCTRNKDAGFQISNGGANNKFYNCTSNYNADAKGENADGFAVKLHSGEGNYFENCIAEYNSDDGWDCYAAHGAVTLINCQANYNGYCDGIYGDGNGFKLGGVDNKTSGVAAHLDPVNHYLKGCVAKGNYASGFDRNNQSGVVTMENCTGDGNKKKNFNWPAKGTPSALGYEVTFGKAIIKNCTSKNGSNNISGATLQGTNSGF